MALKIQVNHSQAFKAKQAAKRAVVSPKPTKTGNRMNDALSVIACAELPATLVFMAQITTKALDVIQAHCEATGGNVADLTPSNLLQNDPAYSHILADLDDAWRGQRVSP